MCLLKSQGNFTDRRNIRAVAHYVVAFPNCMNVYDSVRNERTLEAMR